ncbi:MAG: hypothetical protein HN578_13755 [Rhodospirillales bacterium]|nr:hypothetical protein [Rhodospirillales bacterium]MBT8003972.1 hypothetical protein [Rhodospirillales bacterium]
MSDAGFHVLISGFFRYFRVSQYLSGNTREPLAIVTGTEGLGDVFCEEYYDGLTGSILEGLGLMFSHSTVLYVYLTSSDTSNEDLPVTDDLRPLLTYLRDRHQIVFIDDYAPLPA